MVGKVTFFLASTLTGSPGRNLCFFLRSFGADVCQLWSPRPTTEVVAWATSGWTSVGDNACAELTELLTKMHLQGKPSYLQRHFDGTKSQIWRDFPNKTVSKYEPWIMERGCTFWYLFSENYSLYSLKENRWYSFWLCPHFNCLRTTLQRSRKEVYRSRNARLFSWKLQNRMGLSRSLNVTHYFALHEKPSSQI